MPDSTFGPLRIWEGSRSLDIRGPSPPVLLESEGRSALVATGMGLVGAEMLRAPHSSGECAPPLSLQWFLELEHVRHNRQGRWIPRLLEFGKHQGERLLGLGSALGSDLVRYARCGAEVVAACSSADQLALIRRNFELRGLSGVFLHATPQKLPLESASIDVACITGLLHESDEPCAIIDEVYRVLKPGGKVLSLVPAHYDIGYWSRLFFLIDRVEANHPSTVASTGLLSPNVHRFRSRELRQLFHRFHETRISKRHLRRAEVPHLWRWMPLSLIERVGGRLLVFKGFKPVSAARSEQAAA